MTRHDKHERPRTNSGASGASFFSVNSERGNGRQERDHNVSPGSYGPRQSPPANPASLFTSHHRRELAVLQPPAFMFRHNPPSATNSPSVASSAANTPGSFHLNSSIFEHGADPAQLTPGGYRPGTASSTLTGGTPGNGPNEYPFPVADEQRRPSVASSTGSKSSKHSRYKNLFSSSRDGGSETAHDSPGSSEYSIPPNATPRSHYSGRPSTPTGSRPRTPVPSADVVPFLYQDPEDLQRLGNAPIHDTPVQEHPFRDERESSTSSHSHRIHLGSRGRNRDKGDKDLQSRPIGMYLDGSGSTGSSQIKMLRSASPTPSIASSLSQHAPRSPGELPPKSSKIWKKIGGFVSGGRDKDKHDKDGDGNLKRLRNKSSEPLLKTSTGPPPIGAGKRGSGGSAYVHPGLLDFMPVSDIKKAGKGSEGKSSKSKKKQPQPPEQESLPIVVDLDISREETFRNPHSSTDVPQKDSSWFQDDATEKKNEWVPPESWDTWAITSAPELVDLEPDSEKEPGVEDIQYCIRVFRADSTFATLSCKLNASVTEVLGLLGRKSFLQNDLTNYQIVMRKNGVLKILGPNERPLKIQKHLLEQAGYTQSDHLDEIGREDHSYLVRFMFMMARTGGYSLDQDPGLTKIQKFNHIDLRGRNLLTIPITLYHKASDIISLNLSRNLSLNIPTDFIQQCVNLRKIEYTGNEAERLPPSFAAAHRLTYLDISSNKFEELDGPILDQHHALVFLRMANNQLRHLPDTFSKFKSLRILDISSNYLTSFPLFICELTTLVDLNVSFNMIRNFPPQIGQLTALEKLSATNNKLKGSLPSTFSDLGALQQLDLRFNYDLQNIDVVAQLPKLEAVLVGHNRISGFQHSFQKLRALHLNSNPITRFSLPTAMPTLSFLNLSKAKIAAINETLFDKLPNLTRLILDENHISQLPPQIGKLKKLEHLSVTANELTKLPPEIGLLSELKFLDLHFNNLGTLPGEIWQLSNLITLNLSSNGLKELPRPVTYKANESMYADANGSVTPKGSISEASGDDRAEGVKSRQGGGASLLSVGVAPGHDGRKGSMVSLYGEGGRKSSVVSKASTDASSTPTLGPRKDSAASYNKMSHTFVGSLRYLYLADNVLSDAVFEELSLLTELRVLNLSYNMLFDIPSRALSRLSHLNELYLSGNELTALPAEDLEHVSSLKVLHLNGNKFQTLPAELGKIRKLLVLDVGSNTLKYNISNWPYDWNWNWNLDLKYLNLSGNKRLEIKPNLNDPHSVRNKNITDFSQLNKLRVLGLMDVTLTMTNVPDQTEDRRVRLLGSKIRSMPYGMADTLGRNEHLSMFDMVQQDFRGSMDEWLIGMFDGQALTTGGSKVSKFLHESLEFILKDELSKLRADEKPTAALRRAFLNLNKELAASAMQSLDDRTLVGGARHPSTGSAPLLGPDDLNSGGTATVVYIQKDNIYVANVGDAMAFLVTPNGEHTMLTQKHDPGQEPELSRIREAGGWVSRTGKLNDTLDVSRAFGYTNLMPAVNAAPHISEATLNDQDEVLLIGSRELWEYVSPQSAADIIKLEAKNDLMRAAAKLRDFAIAYGATSKVMVMLLGVGELKNANKKRRMPGLPGGHSFSEEDGKPLVYVRPNRQLGLSNLPPNNQLRHLKEEVKAPEGELALVFTDIKNSTWMWETVPTAMRAGIKIHNSLMRRQLRNIGGYEVKTEGDSFMVCFPTATSALRWCFIIQKFLLEQEWPSEILESEGGREVVDQDGNIIYRGLSVRMGIHWGQPVCEPDPITGRMDYFGPMVNRAARIEAEADGGQITVSSDFVAEINRCVKAFQDSEAGIISPEEAFGDLESAQEISRELRLLSNEGFEIKELGERKLKGLENPEFIYHVYPTSLVGRQTARANQTTAAAPRRTVKPEDVWALWDISTRLEMLCSSLNTDHIPSLRSHSIELISRLRDAPDTASDFLLVPLLEHITTRIENCMTILYLRRLLAPNDAAHTGGRLTDLIDVLEDQLGVHLPKAPPPPPESEASDDGDTEIGEERVTPDLSPLAKSPSLGSSESVEQPMS